MSPSQIFFIKKVFWEDSTNFKHRKMTLKVGILRRSRRLFIILVILTMLISSRCIHGFMSNLIKKSWRVSNDFVLRFKNEI